MKISAIICEYNPFHNGHKYQIDMARRITNCDAVIALMSGNFVQRGDFSLFPKATRSNAALSCGIDLVLENPTHFVLRSAEGYASSAVYTLSALGCVDSLVFGAECDDLSLLKEIANILSYEDDNFKKLLSENLKEGISFASARSNVIESILGQEASKILSKPNNLLAIEYLKAIIRQGSSLKPVVIKRIGVGHNASTTALDIASASYIRENFTPNAYLDFVPQNTRDLYKNSVYFDKNSADKAIIASLNLLSRNDFTLIPDISEGLENKIKSALMEYSSVTDVIENVKSKRYAYSRIQRALLCAYLRISKGIYEKPLYIKPLDFNTTGQAILNIAKKTATLPLAKNASPLKSIPSAMELWQRELEFDRIYGIFANQAQK